MNFKILNHVIQPEWMKPSTRYSAGVDLRAVITEPLELRGGDNTTVGTGIAIQLPKACGGLLMPRSGLGRAGLVLGNLVGLVDADYNAEVKLALWNRNDPYTKPIVINPLDRIAQLMVVPVRPPTEWVEVQDLGETERGAGSFGSTGRE